MIIACYILHYGAEWLYWSLRSVAEHVDEINLFYTPFPSHGFATNLTNPESRDDVRNQVFRYVGDGYVTPAYWHDTGRFLHEGLQRTYAVNYCRDRGADVVVVVDADELWPTGVLGNALKVVYGSAERNYCIRMRHFWRSLKWVCDDEAMPTRLIKPNVLENTTRYLDMSVGKVFHMGYAQKPAIIKYKQDIHGHKNEWRGDWFENKFLYWQNGVHDVHPTNVNFWDPKLYWDAEEKLEELCFDHPYWGKDIIE